MAAFLGRGLTRHGHEKSSVPRRHVEPELARMLDGITPENLHGEVDFGSATGYKSPGHDK